MNDKSNYQTVMNDKSNYQTVMNDKSNYQTVMSGIDFSNKFDTAKIGMDMFDGTPYSARVPMGHEHLIQVRPQMQNNNV